MFTRLCALALAILAASPFTAPFATRDLSALLPAAHRKVVHHRTYDSGRITAIDVDRVDVFLLKRIAGWVIPSPVRRSRPVAVAPAAVARAILTESLGSSFRPLRI